MQCNILKPFQFSRDGVTPEQAIKGSVVDIPDALVSGLDREGFVGKRGGPAVEAKNAGSAPENKMEPEPASENKGVLAELRGEYELVVGKRPFMGWDAATLRQKIAEATEDGE